MAGLITRDESLNKSIINYTYSFLSFHNVQSNSGGNLRGDLQVFQESSSRVSGFMHTSGWVIVWVIDQLHASLQSTVIET